MIALDVTPFGPSDVAVATVVVVLPVASAVVVGLLDAKIVGVPMSASTATTPTAASAPRHERSTPRILSTLPPRW
jgi:hypothetical protein